MGNGVMLEFPSMEKPISGLASLAGVRRAAFCKDIEPPEEEDAWRGGRCLLGSACGRGQRVFPGSFLPFTAINFAPQKTYRIQMAVAKSSPLCGAAFAATAALGTEIGCGSWGAGAAPPAPTALPDPAGSAGALPTLGLPPFLALGTGSSWQPACSQAFAG